MTCPQVWYVMGSLKRKRDDTVITYSSRSSDGSQIFSNFYYSVFTLDGLQFTSVEDYFHWRKTGNAFFVNRPFEGDLKNDKDLKKHGLAALKKARELGGPLPPGWHSPEPFGDGLAFQVMTQAMTAKFAQNEHLKNALLATQETPLLHTERFMYSRILNDQMQPKVENGSYGKFYWACMKPADSAHTLIEVFEDAYKKAGKEHLWRQAWDVINAHDGVQCEKWIGMNRTGFALMHVRNELRLHS